MVGAFLIAYCLSYVLGKRLEMTSSFAVNVAFFVADDIVSKITFTQARQKSGPKGRGGSIGRGVDWRNLSKGR